MSDKKRNGLPDRGSTHKPSALWTRERRELSSIAQALCGVEIRRSRVTEVKRAIEAGVYRVPAQVLAASLILEMLQ